MSVVGEIMRVFVILLVMGFGLSFVIAATIQYDNWINQTKIK